MRKPILRTGCVAAGILAISTLASAGRAHELVVRGEIAKLEALLGEEPGLVNEKDGQGQTPLHAAVVFGRADMTALLLEKGADVNARDGGGQTPLHLVSSAGNVEVVALVVRAGADVTAKNNLGRTAFWTACSLGRRDLAAAMVENGAEPDIFTAVVLDMDDFVLKKLAAKPGTAKEKYYTGETLLHVAAGEGRPAIVSRLIELDADVNGAGGLYGFTPLHLGALGGHVNVAEKLVAAGAKVDARSGPGWHFIGGYNRFHNGSKTALHLAVQRGHAAMAGWLIARGADVNARDSFGSTPIHQAVALGDPALVKLILGHKPRLDLGCFSVRDTEMQQMDGVDAGRPIAASGTPLHIARQKKHEEIVKALIGAGASEDPTADDLLKFGSQVPIFLRPRSPQHSR